MRHVVFKTTHRRQQLLLWPTLAVFLVLALVGCGGDGGVPVESNDNTPTEVTRGVDRQDVEFSGVNAEVQKVTVDGTECVIANAYDDSVALSCNWDTP